MLTPRPTDLIVRELNEVNQLLANHHRMQVKHPDDAVLLLSTQQFEYRKKQLLKELHLSLSVYFTELAA